jgi:hypothetical protein
MIELTIDNPIKLHEIDSLSFMIEFSESQVVNYYYAETKINGKSYINFVELQSDFGL